MEIVTERELLSPSTQHIVITLENRIHVGIYRNGQWLPSEREIAQEFGVSRIIVQSVVRELENRRLVVRAARCRPVVQYQPDIPTVSKATKPSTSRHNLGIWMWPHPGDANQSMILQGIRKAIDGDTYRLIVESPVEAGWDAVHRSERRFLTRMAQDQDIAGIIIWYLGAEKNLDALEMLRAQGVPMIFIDRRPPEGFDADYVGVDNTAAAELVVRHLIKQGHRSIAHISNYDTASTVRERMEGYRHALESAEIPFREELVCRDPGPPEECLGEGLEPIITQLLELPEPPTAIFAVSDYVAQRTHSALRVLEAAVPEEIALAGFDGIERWNVSGSFITTANQPFESIGMRAVEALMRRLDLGTTDSWQHILLEAPLAVHRSTLGSRLHHPAPRSF